MNVDAFKNSLCQYYCNHISVSPVSYGYAVSTAFIDNSNDPIGFYIVETDDGYYLEDDGEYLTHLIASGIDIDKGQRNEFLRNILAQADAHYDVDSYEIRTAEFPPDAIPRKAFDFVSALLRMRDLEMWTRETVRSTFKEDALRAMEERFAEIANIDENTGVNRQFSAYPADAILRPVKYTGRDTAVYFVTNNDKLNEALLLDRERRLVDDDSFSVVAMFEEPEMRGISRKRFQRAQNRGLPMPFFRDDEDAALNLIASKLELAS
jgi:hypothetical protein